MTGGHLKLREPPSTPSERRAENERQKKKKKKNADRGSFPRSRACRDFDGGTRVCWRSQKKEGKEQKNYTARGCLDSRQCGFYQRNLEITSNVRWFGKFSPFCLLKTRICPNERNELIHSSKYLFSEANVTLRPCKCSVSMADWHPPVIF